MPDNNVIIEIIAKDSASGTIKKFSSSIKELGSEARAAGVGIDQATLSTARASRETEATGRALGMTRREWMRTGSEAAFYMTSMVGRAGAMSKELSGIAGMATQLGESFMFGGGVGIGLAAVTTAVGLVANEINKANEAAKAALAPFEAFGKALQDLDKASGPIAQHLREQYDLTKQQAEALADLASKSEIVRENLQKRNELDKEMIAVGRELHAEMMNVAMDNEGNYGATNQARVDALTKKLTELSAQRDADRGKMQETATATTELAAISKQAAETDDYYQRRIRALAAGYGIAAERAREYEAALKKVRDATSALLRGMVEKALTPTEVTQEDIDATKSGKYVDKWDEARRRWESIAKGEGAQFGPEIEQLKALGMSADEAARKFKDFSLFADPKTLKMGLVDWGALTTDVEGQLDAMIGKFNLTSEAVKRVWDRLPEDKKNTLAKLGIMNMDDATKAALGMKPGEYNLVPSESFMANLANIRGSILENIPKEMQTTVYVTYTTATGGGAPPPGNEAGAGAGAAAPKNTGWGGIPEFAGGGTGIFNQTGLIQVHQGEQYWISGTKNEVPPPAAPQVHVNATLNNNLDVQRLAYKIAREIQRRRS